MRKATRAQLVIIRYHDPLASEVDKTDAENELKRREENAAASQSNPQEGWGSGDETW